MDIIEVKFTYYRQRIRKSGTKIQIMVKTSVRIKNSTTTIQFDICTYEILLFLNICLEGFDFNFRLFVMTFRDHFHFELETSYLIYVRIKQ